VLHDDVAERHLPVARHRYLVAAPHREDGRRAHPVITCVVHESAIPIIGK
jgi:hypothetical protein